LAEYANPETLVETDWLRAHIGDPSVRPVEVYEDSSLYAVGHIPGPAAWNWKADLHDPLRRDFIDQAQLARLLQRSGVGKATKVVLYSGNNNWFAAYGLWLLRYLGFDHAVLLNGGRKKWALEGRELTIDVPDPYDPEPPVELGPMRPEVRVLRDEVIKAVDDQSSLFVDVRSQAEFTGEVLAPPGVGPEQAQVGGHIPGATNIPWSMAAREDGTFKSSEELRRLYAATGIHLDTPTIAYCRIGERSSHTWFVLTELLGFQNVKNYDGSWTEYGSMVGVPVEVGYGSARHAYYAERQRDDPGNLMEALRWFPQRTPGVPVLSGEHIHPAPGDEERQGTEIRSIRQTSLPGIPTSSCDFTGEGLGIAFGRHDTQDASRHSAPIGAWLPHCRTPLTGCTRLVLIERS
jgi:thiosulfate/3-mercaptopyruvate sulfurtransferase